MGIVYSYYPVSLYDKFSSIGQEGSLVILVNTVKKEGEWIYPDTLVVELKNDSKEYQKFINLMKEYTIYNDPIYSIWLRITEKLHEKYICYGKTRIITFKDDCSYVYVYSENCVYRSIYRSVYRLEPFHKEKRKQLKSAIEQFLEEIPWSKDHGISGVTFIHYTISFTIV